MVPTNFLCRIGCFSFFLFMFTSATMGGDRPIVIAHRGASGYLPEHTLPAVSLAHGMGADYIEQDVVLSKDSVPMVLHDVHIDTVTNVATKFPSRKRTDGRFYAIDFTLAELKTLSVNERIDVKSGERIFPKRFPAKLSNFQIATLEEVLELIRGLNQTTGRAVGIYPEIKSPAWHREQGFDISKIVLRVLQKHLYRSSDDLCFLQCFEQKELARIQSELGSKLKLIQLLGNEAKDFSQDKLKEIASYAAGIGPPLSAVMNDRADTGLVLRAHMAGLKVHPYTFRVDALASGFNEPATLMKSLFVDAGADGVFSDFPDVCVEYLNSK